MSISLISFTMMPYDEEKTQGILAINFKKNSPDDNSYEDKLSIVEIIDLTLNAWNSVNNLLLSGDKNIENETSILKSKIHNKDILKTLSGRYGEDKIDTSMQFEDKLDEMYIVNYEKTSNIKNKHSILINKRNNMINAVYIFGNKNKVIEKKEISINKLGDKWLIS